MKLYEEIHNQEVMPSVDGEVKFYLNDHSNPHYAVGFYLSSSYCCGGALSLKSDWELNVTGRDVMSTMGVVHRGDTVEKYNSNQFISKIIAELTYEEARAWAIMHADYKDGEYENSGEIHVKLVESMSVIEQMWKTSCVA